MLHKFMDESPHVAKTGNTFPSCHLTSRLCRGFRMHCTCALVDFSHAVEHQMVQLVHQHANSKMPKFVLSWKLQHACFLSVYQGVYSV